MWFSSVRFGTRRFAICITLFSLSEPFHSKNKMHLQGLKNVGAMGNVKNNFIIFNGTSYNALPIDANGMTLATTAPTPPTNHRKVTWFHFGTATSLWGHIVPNIGGRSVEEVMSGASPTFIFRVGMLGKSIFVKCIYFFRKIVIFCIWHGLSGDPFGPRVSPAWRPPPGSSRLQFLEEGRKAS